MVCSPARSRRSLSSSLSCARSLLVRQGGAQLGMEAQPEFWVAGGVAVLAIMAMEGMSKGGAAPVRKKVVKRR